ncbi:MAG TPA: FHA domain-containing protein [Chloroflexia bacterium]
MRCPNCGNENPPDYVFCDECGARLLGGDDTGVAAQAAVADTGAGTGANDQSQAGDAGLVGAGGPVQQGYSSSQGGQPPASAGQYDGGQGAGQAGGYGGDSGPMGGNALDAGGDQSSAGAQGSADAGAGVGAGAGAGTTAGADGSGAGQQAPQAAYGGDAAYGVDQSAGAVGTDVPATEDTVQTGSAGQDQGWQPGADDSDAYAPTLQADGGQGSTMPGVVEIDEQDSQGSQESQDTQGAAGAAPVASGETYSDAGVGAQAGGQGPGEWASQALTLLDQAQAALSRGDWAAFGSGMSELRSYLTGIGATTSTPAWTTSSAGSYGGAATSTTAGAGQGTTGSAGQPGGYAGGGTGTDQGASYGGAQPYGGYNEPTYSGGTSQGDSGTPSLEPEAEAGTLGAQEGRSYDTDYAPANSSGAEAGETQDAGQGTADATADATAGAGVGMMTQAASQAAVGGVAASTNGASENMMARLVIISTGAELPIPDQEEIMVGREDPSSGIFPDVDLTAYGGEEGGVSRRHARLLHINGEYFVEDLQSTNFTKLDGQRLPAHVRERLEDGARIDFGRVATIFRRS